MVNGLSTTAAKPAAMLRGLAASRASCAAALCAENMTSAGARRMAWSCAASSHEGPNSDAAALSSKMTSGANLEMVSSTASGVINASTSTRNPSASSRCFVTSPIGSSSSITRTRGFASNARGRRAGARADFANVLVRFGRVRDPGAETGLAAAVFRPVRVRLGATRGPRFARSLLPTPVCRENVTQTARHSLQEPRCLRRRSRATVRLSRGRKR